MKKKAAAFALAVSTAVLAAGCGSKDPAYLSGINAEEYVDVADYSAIPVEEAAPSVSDDYLDMYIQYQLTMSQTLVEITDRDDVEEGDVVNIDYVGTLDGVAFDGGTATGYDLTIGSGSFIDGFEDGLIGAKVGDTVELNLTFPEDYSSNEDLAGQDVVFTVTINKIQEYQTPELTDEWAASQGIDGVETADEYRTYIYDQLMEYAQETYDSDVQNAVVAYLEDNSTWKQDPPTEMVDRFNQSYTDSLTSYATQYGMDLATLMSYMNGSTEDTYEQDIRDMAENAAKEYIIMQVIADKEDLNVSDIDYNTKASTTAASMGYSSVDAFEEAEDGEAYREYLMVENVLEYLEEHAVVTEPSEDAASESSAEATSEDSAEETSDAAAEETAEASAEETTEEAAESLLEGNVTYEEAGEGETEAAE